MFLSIAFALISAVFMYGVGARKSTPEFLPEAEVKFYRSKLNKIALYSSAAFGVLVAVLADFNSDELMWQIALSVAVVVVNYVFVISCWSDHKHRMVDRKLIRMGMLLGGATSIPQLILDNNELVTVSYIVAIIISASILFLSVIGASDARAYILLFLVAFPTIGFQYTQYIFMVGIGLIILFGLFYIFIKKTSKASIPLIPYILGPYCVMVLLLFIL